MPVRLRHSSSSASGSAARRRAAVAAADVAAATPPEGDGLRCEDLSVAFGGLVAVDGLSFAVPLGRITGLIGPNGAGKTTIFDACCGLNRRVRGQSRCAAGT